MGFEVFSASELFFLHVWNCICNFTDKRFSTFLCRTFYSAKYVDIHYFPHLIQSFEKGNFHYQSFLTRIVKSLHLKKQIYNFLHIYNNKYKASQFDFLCSEGGLFKSRLEHWILCLRFFLLFSSLLEAHVSWIKKIIETDVELLSTASMWVENLACFNNLKT
jgi:hypothetical protein